MDLPQLLPPEKWPVTVEATVKDIIARMSESDKELVRKRRKDGLIQFHFHWGTGIRNYYGLLRGNKELLRSACGPDSFCDADEASMRIIEAVWEALQISK
jgi:hypothetical protein